MKAIKCLETDIIMLVDTGDIDNLKCVMNSAIGKIRFKISLAHVSIFREN